MTAKSNGSTAKHGFQKGQSGNPVGRVPGVPNRRTALLKDAILLAAANVGDEVAWELARVAEERGGEVVRVEDLEGGLVGYLMHAARRHPTAFIPLLGRVLPLVVQGGEKPITIEMQERADKFTRAIQQLADRADKARCIS